VQSSHSLIQATLHNRLVNFGKPKQISNSLVMTTRSRGDCGHQAILALIRSGMPASPAEVLEKWDRCSSAIQYGRTTFRITIENIGPCSTSPWHCIHVGMKPRRSRRIQQRRLDAQHGPSLYKWQQSQFAYGFEVPSHRITPSWCPKRPVISSFSAS